MRGNCGKAFEEYMAGIKPKIGNFNIYGRIVFKRAIWCSYFYKLLCANDKNEGWEKPSNAMKRDLTNFEK